MRKQWQRDADTFVVTGTTRYCMCRIYIAHAQFAFVHSHRPPPPSRRGLFSCPLVVQQLIQLSYSHRVINYGNVDTYIWCTLAGHVGAAHWWCVCVWAFFFLLLIFCCCCVHSLQCERAPLFCLCRWSVIYNGTHDKSSAQYWIVVHDAERHFLTLTQYKQQYKCLNIINNNNSGNNKFSSYKKWSCQIGVSFEYMPTKLWSANI